MKQFLKTHARRFVSHMNPPVFLGSAAVVILFVAFGASFSDLARQGFGAIQSFLVGTFGWLYILTATLLLIFVVFLAFSRFGRVKLGEPDDEPEFHTLTWFSMMMSAGMGIGIVFFGAAEPIEHYMNPPMGEGQSPEAVTRAMRYTFFHWGLHPWAIYCAFALPLAYFHFRLDQPMAPRSLLWPLLGEGIHGKIGHGIDILCTTGTLFGVATSLGLGAIQINGGLNKMFGVPSGPTPQIILIACITVVATISVVSGLKVGIRRLSEFNIGLAALILVFVLVTGPTLYVVRTFITGVGDYLQHLPEMSFWINPKQDDGWQADWTLFYWSWWISWSPFVGVFVARISRGRTIREFVIAALLVPTLLGFLWFSVIGGTALHVELYGAGGVSDVTLENNALALYQVLGELPIARISWFCATLLIVIFFITSSDSGSLVDDMVTSGGDPDPPRVQRVFWAVSEGAVAATLLLAGGLTALRTASLTTGLPMSVFLLVAAVGLIRALRRDPMMSQPIEAHEQSPDKEETTAGQTANGGDADDEKTKSKTD